MLLLFGVVYFLEAVVTCGLSIPAGLFIPSLLCGATMGRLFGEVLQMLTPADWSVHPGIYALVGSASLLAGMTRITISLCVMMIEATGNVRYGLPLMLAIMGAKLVGDAINAGLYDQIILVKHWPFLEASMHNTRKTARMKAKHIMRSELAPLPEVVSVRRLLDVLNADPSVNAFPVTRLLPGHLTRNLQGHVMCACGAQPSLICHTCDTVLCGSCSERIHSVPALSFHLSAIEPIQQGDDAATQKSEKPSLASKRRAGGMGGVGGEFAGYIMRRHLVTILEYHAWFDRRVQPGEEEPLCRWEHFEEKYPKYTQLADVVITEADRSKWVDLTPYLHPTPFTVFESTPLNQCYRLFRTMGMRHLFVLDHNYHAIGLITRKDLSEEGVHHHAARRYGRKDTDDRLSLVSVMTSMQHQ